MKKLFVLISLIFCTASGIAQDERKIADAKQDSVYCLVMKDGLAVLVNSAGRIVNHNIELSDGTSVSVDGLVTKKDGSQVYMKEGDCTNTISGQQNNGKRKSK